MYPSLTLFDSNYIKKNDNNNNNSNNPGLRLFSPHQITGHRVDT